MTTLDYFRGVGTARSARTPWVRVFCSHRARLEMARTASVGQGFLLLAVIALVAGLLSASPTRLHAMLTRIFDPQAALLPPGEVLLKGGMSAGKTVAVLSPLYFGLLCAALTLAASLWTRCSTNRPWSRCFAALAVGVAPVAWFFLLVQIECLAPLIPGAVTATNWWNPFTNAVHFAVLMGSVGLAGVWAIDANRLYVGLDTGETLPTR